MIPLRGSAWLDYIYPPYCEICDLDLSTHREGAGRWLCHSCTDELPAVPTTCCKTCGMPYDGQITDEFRCGNCAHMKLHFHFAYSPFHAEGEIRHLVHRFKYQKELYLRGLLANLLADAFRRDPRLKALSPAEWVLVPVPLHLFRQWQRGFNQAWELSKELSKITGLPAIHALKRSRYTRAQAKLGRTERLQNLKNSFRLKKWPWQRTRPDLIGKNVLLVDDVLTTGSTANECARALRKQANVQKVVVISLARG